MAKRVNVAVIVNSDNLPKPVTKALYGSGDWSMSYSTALGLIGGMFSVHEKQNSESIHQGIVVGFERISSTRFKIFYIPIKGSMVGRGLPWAQEMAIY